MIDTVTGPSNRLELVEGERRRPGSRVLAERARYDSRLAGPLTQLHLVVDGVSVIDRVLEPDLEPPFGFAGEDLVSVVDLAWPEYCASSLQQLAGRRDRDPAWEELEPGRLPLYGCAECDDLYCGPLTVAIGREGDAQSGHELVSWTDFRCGRTGESPGVG